MNLRWLVLATGWVASLPYCSGLLAQPMERPTLNVADSWTYQFHEAGTLHSPGNFDYIESVTVSDVYPTQYAMSKVTTAQRDGVARRVAYRITRDLNGYARQNPSLPWAESRWLQWPLEPGQSWKLENPIAAGIQVWEAHVKGWEEVEVPAGKFRAIRIVYDLIASPDPLIGWQSTLWYAPAVKSYVKKTDSGWYEATVTIKRDVRELNRFQLQ